MKQSCLSVVCTSGLIVICLLGSFSDAISGGKVGLYGIYMAPQGSDAMSFSESGVGLGAHIVAPVTLFSGLVAGVGGIEVINLLSETTEFVDRVTGLRVEQQTDQNYYRLYGGGQIGGHGNGFLRPHAGVNIAIVLYEIQTDVVVPDDFNRENEIRQSLRAM